MLTSEDSAFEAPQSLFGPHSAGPTVQRLVLGGHLRRLREEASITTEQAAGAIRGSHSKISRMEHGRVGFKDRDIADLLTLYGVTSGEEREVLLKLAREANTPGWWQGYSDILPHWVEPYFGLEAAASIIRIYELQFVPGLLQTADYARAIIRLGNASTEEDVTRRAEARIARQEILTRENPPRLWAVMDDGALRRSIGGKAVMREVLRARPARRRVHRAADQRPVPGQGCRGRQLPRSDGAALPAGRARLQDAAAAQGRPG